MKTIKQQLGILIFLLFSGMGYAQTEGVSIKTTVGPPHPSAMLDVESITKGVLIPRVALTNTSSASPIATTPATGLLVYNITSNTNVSPGFYFWNGTGWVQFASSSGGNQWIPGPANLVTDIHRTGGAVTVGTVTSTYGTGPAAKLTVNGPSILFSGNHAANSTHTTIPGVHIGEPLDGLGGHWNEINTRGTYLDMQFDNGEEIQMGAIKGTNLSVRKGTMKPGDLVVEGFTWLYSGYWSGSDSTIKKNITPYDNVLPKIDNLHTYSYNYKTESNDAPKHIGVIAQEIQSQIPEASREKTEVKIVANKFGTENAAGQGGPVTVTTRTKMVDYDALTAVLLQAIKEQQAQINDLKARVTALENR
jgi:hypothetical protein